MVRLDLGRRGGYCVGIQACTKWCSPRIPGHLTVRLVSWRELYRWFVTASGVPGALPSSQPIEAYNKNIKGHFMGTTRVRLDAALETHFPQWLLCNGAELTGDITRVAMTPAGRPMTTSQKQL
jgi:hypothetical protein